MPNWVRNELIVTGKAEDVSRFVDYVGQTMDFENIIPPPANMFLGDLPGETFVSVKQRKECAEKGIPNWYDWQIEHWGTKWNACYCEEVIVLERFDGVASSNLPFENIPSYGFAKAFFEHPLYTKAIYRFDTACSTPEPVIRRIIEDWPDLDIGGGYIDESYEFCGSFKDYVIDVEEMEKSYA